MPKSRDSQRSKIYRSDNVIPGDLTFGSVAEVEEYLDGILRKAWFKNRWPRVANYQGIKVHDGRGTRIARASYGVYGGWISLPRWARNEAVLLHELAHVCVRSKYNVYKRAAHGREYAATLLQLVTWKMGKEVGDKLRDAYREHGVKWYRRNGNG